MSFSDQGRFLKSRPLRTRMLGMESTTAQMQQAGWEFSADQDVQRMGLRVIGRHQQGQMYIVSDYIRMDFLAALHSPSVLDALVINFPYVANHLRLTMPIDIPAEAMNYRPIDMIPQYCSSKNINIEDLGIFATPLVRTKEIIIPEESVDNLLDKLLEFQEPIKAEYAKHTLRKSHEGTHIEARPQQRFHAQILSIAS